MHKHSWAKWPIEGDVPKIGDSKIYSDDYEMDDREWFLTLLDVWSELYYKNIGLFLHETNEGFWETSWDWDLGCKV